MGVGVWVWVWMWVCESVGVWVWGVGCVSGELEADQPTHRFSRCTRPAIHRNRADPWGLSFSSSSASGMCMGRSIQGGPMWYLGTGGPHQSTDAGRQLGQAAEQVPPMPASPAQRELDSQSDIADAAWHISLPQLPAHTIDPVH
jgi:hypothetical protein